MPLEVMDRLPDEARVWVFGTSRELEKAESDVLLDTVDRYLSGWVAHGNPLRAARSWLEGRFLIVAVDESSAPPSGCSIDALVRELTALEERLDVSLVGHGAVWYRDADGRARRADRKTFKDLVASGHATGKTTVFDDTVMRLHQIRTGEFEKPASSGWHARAFGL